MKQLVKCLGWCVLLLPAAIGCGGDDSGGSDSTGRGSVACHDWQNAVCDLAVDDCKTVSRAACDHQYQSIACKSDEAATACANKLNAATCTSLPAGCDAQDIADTAPAIAACKKYLETACKWEVSCSAGDTMDKCLTTLESTIDCSKALGVEPTYEDCLTDYASLPCTATTGPNVCNSVILAAP